MQALISKTDSNTEARATLMEAGLAQSVLAGRDHLMPGSGHTGPLT